MSDLLKDYGVEFMYSPDKAEEVQYRCPIHGRDNKPSARFYRSTQTCYCWFCQKKWDAISFVRDKENLSYTHAMMFLVHKYKIDTSVIPDTLDIEEPKKEIDPEESKIQENIALSSIRGKIKEFRGKISLEKYKILCRAYFMILYEKSKGNNVLNNLKKFELKLNRVSNE